MFTPTEKLYDRDAYLSRFESEVLSVEKTEGGYAVVLKATAFFPEEGGQACDTGTLGGVPVLHVALGKDGVIVHTLTEPLAVGATVTGEIEFDPRYRKMQHHTGEHIVSGLAHRLYGAENVGFHLGTDDVTMDLDVELDRYALDRIEDLANEAVHRNVAVTARYPSPEELKTLTYRAKLDLTENVRIVTVEGYDDCACCAPHVARTGEIGEIKILDAMRYKGGVRLHLACGMDALRDHRVRYAQTLRISGLLSAKQSEIVEAVEQLKEMFAEEKRRTASLRIRILNEQIASLPDRADGNLLVFSSVLEARELRELVNAGVPRCGGIFAAFAGDDESGYNYVMGATSVDLRALSKELNAALSGRGGGSPSMIQGSCKAPRRVIEEYFGLR